MRTGPEKPGSPTNSVEDKKDKRESLLGMQKGELKLFANGFSDFGE